MSARRLFASNMKKVIRRRNDNNIHYRDYIYCRIDTINILFEKSNYCEVDTVYTL